MMSFPGDQEQFEGAPHEWKDHFLAAMKHQAGLGPHPGKYKGPPLQRQEEPDEDEISELDLQHAREEPLEDERPHEASYKKMKAAKAGGATQGLGPSELQQKQVQQATSLQQQADTQSQVQAAQKQAAMIPQAPSPAQVQGPPPAAPGGKEDEGQEQG